jgi:hypothetical protein
MVLSLLLIFLTGRLLLTIFLLPTDFFFVMMLTVLDFFGADIAVRLSSGVGSTATMVLLLYSQCCTKRFVLLLLAFGLPCFNAVANNCLAGTADNQTLSIRGVVLLTPRGFCSK